MHMISRVFLLFVIILPVFLTAQTAGSDSFYVANWNLENLYDTVNDTLKNDEEFLPGSAKRWNNERSEHKLNNLVKVINYMNNGCGPDIIGLEEVENINVVKSLIYKMRDRDYIVVHRNSPDQRGIDVALMYDRNIFSIEKVVTLHVKLPDGKPTRDILHVVLIAKKNNEKIHLYTNHWPSRIGGEEKSNINRTTAAKILKSSIDTLARTSPKSNIIILGDFNDEPNNESIQSILGAKDFECSNRNNNLLNLSYKKFLNKEGSYLYGGNFDMLDQIIISSTFLDGKKIEYLCNSFEVIKPKFMIYENGKRKGGAKPTYSGSEYVGGFSDHFPVGAKFILKGRK